MSGSSWLVAGALGLGLAGSVAALLGFQARARADGRADTPVSPAPAEAARPGEGKDVERLRGEVALLQRQMLALRDRVAEQKEVAAEAPAAEPETLDPEALQERRKASAQRWKAQMLEVAAAFEQEPLDRNFSTTTKGALDKAIQNNSVIQKVAGNVDCRSRTCRVEIQDAKSPEVSKQLPLFLQAVGPTLRRAQADHVDGESGQKTMVLYLTNEEPALPIPGQ